MCNSILAKQPGAHTKTNNKNPRKKMYHFWQHSPHPHILKVNLVIVSKVT